MLEHTKHTLVVCLLAAAQQPSLAQTPHTVSLRELRMPQKAVEAFYQAQAFAAQGNIAKAIEKYKTATRLNPDYWEAFAAVGGCYTATGKPREALEAYEKAAELGPLNADNQTNLAVGYLLNGNYKDAERAVQQALRLDTKFHRAHYLLGWIMVVTGRPSEAVAHLAAASPVQ